MGQPKLLLPWGPTTVLGHLLQQWSRIKAAQIAVVSAKEANAMQGELDRLSVTQANRIFNAAPDRGMFSSIQCAANWAGWKSELTHFVIALGDQPQLRESTLQGLAAFAEANPNRICQPSRNGRRRHPVLMPKPFFFELGKTSAPDLKSFLEVRGGELAGFECDDSGLDSDLDTPADYERLRQLHFDAA
jgi:molybdenum cofactor cytidylyltransferase